MEKNSNINLFFAGDFCPIGRNESEFTKGHFKSIDSIKNIIDEADYSIVNLEAPLTTSDNRINKSGPNIKALPKTIEALKYLDINLVTLANNHILDYGQEGIFDTLKICADSDIETIGAGKDINEAKKSKNIILKDKRIGILNFAENEFCAAAKNSAGANPVNDIANYYDIIEAKKNNDFVIVIAHGGREHYQLPTPKQRQRFRFYADSGADLIIGHHTHCFSGYEIYNDTPIFYSLGNFIFDYKKKYQKGKWTEGYAVSVKLSDTINFEIIPFKQGRTEDVSLQLMDEKEKKIFFEKITQLNEIITDDYKFSQEWDNYLTTQSLNYLTMLTVQNKYIRAAVNKKLLPNIKTHSKEHLLLLLNLLRCETHNEIMSGVLSKELENER